MRRKKIFGQLQRIGKSLMLPVAVLPAAALLLRFGVLLNLPFVEAAGNAIFNNLALLFAIGVAVGFAFDGSGSAGLAGVVGYFVFRFFIQRFDISTPGRGKAESGASMDIMPEAQREKGRGVDKSGKESGQESSEESTRSEAARQYIEYLGGPENIETVEGCITRLRLEVIDADKINGQKLKDMGATEVMKPTDTNVQVVVGTKAEMIAGEINDELDKMK